MVEHGFSGAMGLVVNRPSSVTVAHVLAQHFNLPETGAQDFVLFMELLASSRRDGEFGTEPP